MKQRKNRFLSAFLAVLVLVGVMAAVPTTARAGFHSSTDIEYPVTGGNIYFDKSTGTITDCDDTVTEAKIPEAIDSVAVKIIGWEAFEFCGSLTSVTIPDGVNSIEHHAFYKCEKLNSVIIPDSVSSVGYYAFKGTALYNDKTNWANGVLYIGKVLIEAEDDLSGIYNIKDGTVVIGEGALYNGTKLTSVMIPNSVITIGAGAFDYCSGITSITIPKSVINIGDDPFSHCDKLANINVAADNIVYASENGVLYNKSKTEIIRFPEDKGGAYSIPNSVTRIGVKAFSGCDRLTGVTIPNGVTSVGSYAFARCSNLKNVYYGGTETQWKAINIDDFGNDPLQNATIHYTDDFDDSGDDTPDDTPTEYAVTTAAAQNGSVTVSPEKAKAGEKVTVTPKPDDGYETDAVTVTDKEGKTVSVTKNSDGTYSFTMPEGDVGVSVTFKEKAPEETTNPFTDVNKGAYYYDAVLWAVNHDPQITTGTSANTFSPDATCTRGQVVTFLWRAAGCPEPTGSSSPFTDVKPGDYYYKAVLWAVEKGITNGTSATTFSPNDGCTRGQVVTFLHRFENTPSAGSASNPFTDVSSGAYYNAAVLWAVKNDITTGTGAGKFSPDDVCTRGQIVTFLYRDMVPNANNNSDKPAVVEETADDPGTVTVKGKARYDLVQAVFDSVNRNRADNGLSAFTLSGQLTEMAMLRAAECVVSFSHTRPKGELCFSIDSDGSYTGGYVNAENIANGQRSASDVMTAWMNSEGHRNNILNRNSTQIGIGCFEYDGTLYWVQLFGTGSDTTTPGSASVSRDVKVKTAA